MFFSAGSSRVSAVPNVTPLIDVLLVLLIIFMVIVPARSMGLPTEEAGSPTTPITPLEPRAFVVEVLPTLLGTGAAYRLDGHLRSLPALRHDLLAAAASQQRPTVWVKGDPSLDYGTVVAVIAEAHAAGYYAVGLLPQE